MAVSSGVYSLIGVAVGSGITSLAQWRLAARTDRLDARVAKRKVGTELHRHGRNAELLAGAPATAKMLSIRFDQDEAWKKHSDRLARQLSDAEWDAVERAYESLIAL